MTTICPQCSGPSETGFIDEDPENPYPCDTCMKTHDEIYLTTHILDLDKYGRAVWNKKPISRTDVKYILASKVDKMRDLIIELGAQPCRCSRAFAMACLVCRAKSFLRGEW